MVRRVSPEIDAERKQQMEEVAEAIILKCKDMFFEIEGVTKATVKYADKTFKKKDIMTGLEFTLAYAYVGARGHVIFGLSPEDDQEFEFLEMNLKELDENFPLIGTHVGKSLGYNSENILSIFDGEFEKLRHNIKKIEEESETAYDNNPTFGMF